MASAPSESDSGSSATNTLCVSDAVISAPTEAALKHRILTIEHGTGGATNNATVHTVNPPAPADTDWTGTVEATVDPSQHVNGGCRAQNAAGTEWECYIGEAAVQHQIIGRTFLRQYAPAPGVG